MAGFNDVIWGRFWHKPKSSAVFIIQAFEKQNRGAGKAILDKSIAGKKLVDSKKFKKFSNSEKRHASSDNTITTIVR